MGNPRLMFESSQTPYQGILHSTNPSATGAVPVHGSTGTLVARDDERIGSTTTMPMSARRPSTMNSFLPAEVPQKSLAVQQRLQISELQFDKFPTLSSFMCWKIRFKTQVSSKVVEMVDSVDELKIIAINCRKGFPEFRAVGREIASALHKITQISHFKKKVSMEEQKAQKGDRFLGGRQIAFMILRPLSSYWCS